MIDEYFVHIDFDCVALGYVLKAHFLKIGGPSKHFNKAVVTFVRATFQKGEKKDALTGAVYMRGKSRYKKGVKSNRQAAALLLREDLERRGHGDALPVAHEE